MSAARRTLAAVVLLLFVVACEGPVGPKGDPGEAGPPGPTPDTGVAMDAAIDSVSADASDIPLEANGLVGRVTDTADRVVAGGRVVLVLAADVMALAETPIDVSLAPAEAALSTIDEPIEDLLDAERGYAEAVTDADGVYRFTTLPEQSVFVVFVPAATDAARLPGGTYARTAQDPASLLGTRLDLEVSCVPSAEARFIGSTACLFCHGRHRSFDTAHSVGLTVPGQRGAHQDTSRYPDFDAILARFDTSLYFYDCDGASPGAGLCKVSETAPAAPAVVSFIADLRLDPSVPPGGQGRYRVVFRNQRAAETASYDVDLVYGGVLQRSQLLARMSGPSGRPMRFPLPFQFQNQGDDGRPDPADWTWRDTGSSVFYDHAAGTLRTPAPDASFDANCAGCHFTGYSAHDGGGAGAFASAVASPEGAYDYDGDGRREQINVGCESCHGPGSEHLEADVRGTAIVSPQLLTPGRALAICGGCHSAPANTPLPLDADGHMPRAGIRRSELLESHFAGSEVDPANIFPSGDARVHRQQYTDHIRSAKYRNESVIVTCDDCHDPHGRDAEPHDLYFGIRDDAGCTSCHSDRRYADEIRMHIAMRTGDDHAGLEDDMLLCTLCHMTRTATGGSHVEGLLDADPATAAPVQYYQGDLATHRYRTSGFEYASEQPATVTQSCGICHRLVLPNPPI